MRIQVKLSDIVEGMESQSFDNRVYMNLKTGEIVFILGEFLRKAEDEESFDHMIEWQRDMMQEAYEIIETDDYIPLPEYEIDEYQMMERFCYTITDSNIQNKLIDSIQGRGAFRRFKDLIHRLNVSNDWYDYRYKAYLQIAKRFCEQNNIAYTGS